MLLRIIGSTAEYEFHQYKVPVVPSVPTTEANSSSTAKFLVENPVDSLTPITEGMFGYSLTRPLHNQDYYYGIFETCKTFNCGIESWHTESGPGVFEAVRLNVRLMICIHANRNPRHRRLNMARSSKWATKQRCSSQ